MADLDKMDRTWLCSVLFMDIANYSSQSVELQMKWKKRFNAYLTEAIHDVPEGDRVILDTGDGAAICFLGAPEVAMFTALQLCRSFSLDAREQQPGLRVRLGINLGPVKLVKDINGALNAIGDGINAGQRIMSFASENNILVSQSFFEVVSRLSDDYKPMFQLKGVETDKHVREHTVYHLVAPGSEKREQIVANADGQAAAAVPKTAASTASSASTSPKGRWLPWLIAGAGLAAAAILGVGRFRESPAPVQAQASIATPEPAATTGNATLPPSTSQGHPSEAPAAGTTAVAQAVPAAGATAGNSLAPVMSRREAKAATVQSKGSLTPPSADAKAAYDDAMRLIGEDKPAQAARRFDDALRASPDYIDAYAGRAEARRMLLQYSVSLEDCNKIIELKADDPRGYNCRGTGREMLNQLETALPDFNEAIRLNPTFLAAWEHRGATYELLQQYDHAIQDFSQAIVLAPRNAVFRVRRGTLYSNLKQYDKAIRDYTEAIRLQPNNKNAYRLRAQAEQATGDTAGAAADREQMKDSPKAKMKDR